MLTLEAQKIINNQINVGKMNTQITLEKLQGLKLNGMAKVYQTILSLPIQDQPTVNQLIARLVEAEIQERSNKKTEMFLRLSKLRYNAVIEQVYCSVERNFSKDSLILLSDCSFIDRADNILITGATGSGKSYLACAIGRQACILGYKTMYLGMNRLIENINQSKIDGTYMKLINQFEKTHLIIIDDFGLQPLDAIIRIALLQILEDRYGKKSVIVTSQLPIAKWYEYIGDDTLADAIMDRMAVNANKIELNSKFSLRNKM